MPPKIRHLAKQLVAAGFVDRGGKGSHRNYRHARGINLTLSGKMGDDAKPYQVNAVAAAIEQMRRSLKKEPRSLD